MIFSSPVFIFIFFPVFYGLYIIVPRSLRNSLILISSILFYLLGTGALAAVAIVAIRFNFMMGICIEKIAELSVVRSRSLLIVSIVTNLIPLFLFKYLSFFNSVFYDIFGVSIVAGDAVWKVVLPLGISFYTFHFISYITDVFRGEITAERKLQRFVIYISLFPHMIAGPVVRFAEIKTQLDASRRTLVRKDLFWGLVIFVLGLAKKTVLADPLGHIVDAVHANLLGLTTYSAWVAAVCYTFQIYFDFSGYTDMAIGMVTCPVS